MERLSDCEKNHIEHERRIVDFEESINVVGGDLNVFYTMFMHQKSNLDEI